MARGGSGGGAAASAIIRRRDASGVARRRARQSVQFASNLCRVFTCEIAKRISAPTLVMNGERSLAFFTLSSIDSHRFRRNAAASDGAVIAFVTSHEMLRQKMGDAKHPPRK